MCTVLGKLKGKKEFTGYKVVVVSSNRYYSPFSGMRYKVGVVKPQLQPGKNAYKHHCEVIVSSSMHYTSKMKGKTGVLLSKKTAIMLAKRWEASRTTEYAVLEMTIKGGLRDACFDDYDTVVGNEIVSMKKIKI